MDINELNDTKTMVDKDHLTHMLDMVFREDILQRDMVIIRTHTVVGRKERLIFLYYSDRNIVKTPTTTSIQLNTTSTAVGFDTIMTVHTTPPHPPPPRNSIPSLDRRQGSVN